MSLFLVCSIFTLAPFLCGHAIQQTAVSSARADKCIVRLHRRAHDLPLQPQYDSDRFSTLWVCWMLMRELVCLQQFAYGGGYGGAFGSQGAGGY
jgi:hypothetical protein